LSAGYRRVQGVVHAKRGNVTHIFELSASLADNTPQTTERQTIFAGRGKTREAVRTGKWK